MNQLAEALDKLAQHLEETKLFQYAPYKWQKEFHNDPHTEKMLMAANQVGKCSSFNTLVETDKGPTPMGLLKVGDLVSSFSEGGLVYKEILSLVQKPRELLYRFWMNDGKWVEVPEGHRVFANGEWLYARSLLLSLKHHQLTSGAYVRLGLLSGALRLMKKRADLRLDYQVYRRLCGQQLRGVPDTDPIAFPSQDDARKHISISWRKGDLDGTDSDSLLLSSGLLSSSDAQHQSEGRSAASESHALCSNGESYLRSLEDVQRLYLESISELLLNHEEARDQGESFSLGYPDGLGLSSSIIGYEVIGEQPLFDIEVEDTHNYIAGGLVNHNTESAAAEIAMHATGRYPEWYKGKRFHKPNLIWAAGKTNEDCRDIIQDKLLGGFDEKKKLRGTGFIPKTAIGEHKTRQAGIGDVIDYVMIRWHDKEGRPTDHWVKVQFKSYEQGWKKFQGRGVDVVWLDEEPDDQKIFTECIARTTNTDGLVLVTFTPLSGRTDMVEYFLGGEHDCYVKTATIHDAEHISPDRAKEMIAKYPAHEREARSLGVPMMGTGRIYPFSQDDIVCKPFEIPSHFRSIIGVDFGIDHPSGTVKLSYDADQDIIYVVKAHKASNMDYVKHASVIKKAGGDIHGDNIPVAWPHDGHKRQNVSTGLKETWKQYVSEGVSMLGRSARYNNDVGGAQDTEPVVEEIYVRMSEGRFKVFETETAWFEEFRNYHRKDGKINRIRDDIMAATNYAVMMLRYAKAAYQSRSQSAPMAPIVSMK